MITPHCCNPRWIWNDWLNGIISFWEKLWSKAILSYSVKWCSVFSRIFWHVRVFSIKFLFHLFTILRKLSLIRHFENKNIDMERIPHHYYLRISQVFKYCFYEGNTPMNTSNSDLFPQVSNKPSTWILQNLYPIVPNLHVSTEPDSFS